MLLKNQVLRTRNEIIGASQIKHKKILENLLNFNSTNHITAVFLQVPNTNSRAKLNLFPVNLFALDQTRLVIQCERVATQYRCESTLPTYRPARHHNSWLMYNFAPLTNVFRTMNFDS